MTLASTFALLLLACLGSAASQAVSSQAPALAPVSIPVIKPQDLDLGAYAVATTNNKLFLPPSLGGTSERSLCNIGPSVWCLSPENQVACGVANTTVDVCGYATTLGNCTKMTIPQFCSNSTLKPLTFNGGLNGAPQGNLGLLVLALYWAPTSCQPGTFTAGGFCSDYTKPGTASATKLMLHGLWPDTGSLYNKTDPQPPLYQGAYQGWTQWCDGPTGNFSQCAVTGGLCPWANATLPNATQSNYEFCMRANNISQCLVKESVVTSMQPLFARYAPGYLGADRTFIDHEWLKHGVCIGGYLSSSPAAFFERAVQWTAAITADGGNAAADLVQSNVGKNITVTSLVTALGRQGNPQCKKNAATGTCQLSEVWWCLGVDAAGFPTELIDCPSGSQLGTCNSCADNNILIPQYNVTGSGSA